MKALYRQLGLASLVPLFWLVTVSLSRAQVTSDDTLSTDVSTQDNLNFIINSGDRVGDNLFHSFDQFSILEGGSASFNNAVDIANIISRVTGGDVSEIDGEISAQGDANLFLINPNGIVFGPEASLSIGGSFIASTAESIQFVDGVSFSATDSPSQPQLTVSIPFGLQFGGTAASIVNQGRLEVEPGNTLALVGGDIFVQDQGALIAEGGRIELGSVASSSRVSLTPIPTGWDLGYEDVQNFQDIQLSQAIIDVDSPDLDPIGRGSGAVQFRGRRLVITNDSFVGGENSGSQPGGGIEINASESVEILDGGEIFTGTLVDQAAGDITIETNQLIIGGDGRVASSTREGAGRGGSITIDARESIELSNGLLSAGTIGEGDVGTISIRTKNLILLQEGLILLTTFDAGNPGTLTVDASESVVIDGQGDRNGLFTVVQEGPGEPSTGAEGRLTINTRQLIVRNGGQISASTSSQGDGGRLSVNADFIELSGASTDGAFPSGLFTSTTGAGNGGEIEVKTDQLIVRDGALISAEAFENSGSAGSIIIQAGQLTVEAGAEVTVSSPQGQAGNLEISADIILLDDGRLSAVTAENSVMGEAGANIELSGLELLLLRNESKISADALEGANGGNLTIDAAEGFIVGAVPSGPEGSDITVNARQGNGGVINITAQGLIGIEPRDTLTPDNDITAISFEGGLPGSIDINTLELDPTQGLEELSNEFAIPPLNQNCQTSGGSSSRLINIGRGGLTSSPYDLLSGDGILEDIYPAGHDLDPADPAAGSGNSSAPPEQIVEARGWMVNARGEVVLVAEAPEVSARNLCYLTSGSNEI